MELKNLKITLLKQLFSKYPNQAHIFILYFLKISKLIKILSQKKNSLSLKKYLFKMRKKYDTIEIATEQLEHF